MKLYTNRCENCGRGCNVDQSGLARCDQCRESTDSICDDRSKDHHYRDRQIHGIILRHDQSGYGPEPQAIESEVMSLENVTSSTCDDCGADLQLDQSGEFYRPCHPCLEKAIGQARRTPMTSVKGCCGCGTEIRRFHGKVGTGLCHECDEVATEKDEPEVPIEVCCGCGTDMPNVHGESGTGRCEDCHELATGEDKPEVSCKAIDAAKFQQAMVYVNQAWLEGTEWSPGRCRGILSDIRRALSLRPGELDGVEWSSWDLSFAIELAKLLNLTRCISGESTDALCLRVTRVMTKVHCYAELLGDAVIVETMEQSFTV